MRTHLALLLAFFACGAVPAAEDELDFAPDTFDRSVDVCENPYAYVNNTWLRDTALPPDRPMWGPRYAVIDRNLQMQHALAERAAAQLARIDAIDSRADLLAVITDSSAQGLDLVFDYYVWARGEDPDRHVIYVEQGGRGLSDRARYLDEDEASRALRTAYRAHLARLLELSGTQAADATRQADAAFALESALARASLSSVELRDLGNLFAVRGIDEVRTIAPRLDWTQLLAAHGHVAVQELSMAQPGFFRELDRRIADTSIADWRAYLRVRLLDTMAPYLASPFAAQHFDFHRKTVQGVPSPSPRWKQVLDALNGGPAHTAMGRLFVDTHLPPRRSRVRWRWCPTCARRSACALSATHG